MASRLLYAILKAVFGPAIRAIWLKRIEGLENLPASGPYIIAANHQSYLDFIVMSAALPCRPTFLAAEKFYTSRLWRPVVAWTGQIQVDRSSSDKSAVVQAAISVLESGQVLALFPQGKRSRTGQIEKTFTGVARLALAAQVPVVPIGIKGAFEAWPPEGRPKFGKRVELVIGSPFQFDDFYNKAGDRAVERSLTSDVMAAIATLASLPYVRE